MNTKYTNQLAVTLAAALTFGAYGAEKNDWANVEALHRGARIGVVEVGLKRVEGRFAGADGTAIRLESGGVTAIRQENVVRVYRIGMSRQKRMLIGAAVGLAAGATIAAGVGSGSNGEGIFAGGAAPGAAVAGGAGIGIAVGSLTGSGYQTIYQKQGGR